MKICADLDAKAAELAAAVAEKERRLQSLEEEVRKGASQEYLHLLGDSDISDVLDKYQLLTVSRERMEGQLATIEEKIAAKQRELHRRDDAAASPRDPGSGG